MQFTHTVFYNSDRVEIDNDIIFYCWVMNPSSEGHTINNYVEKYIESLQCWKLLSEKYKGLNDTMARHYANSWVCGVYYWLLRGYYQTNFSSKKLNHSLKQIDIENILSDYKNCGNQETINGLNNYYNNKTKFVINCHIYNFKYKIGMLLNKNELFNKKYNQRKFPLKYEDL